MNNLGYYYGITASLLIAAGNVSAQTIKLTDFKIARTDPYNTRVEMSAEGKDIALGSFFVRIENTPGDQVPPGFFKRIESGKTYYFLNNGTTNQPSSFLIDNGPVDEDPRVGIFVYTFKTQNWPQGRYTVYMGANNRPAAGAYIYDTRTIKLDVGNVPTEPVSNVPGAINREIFKKDGIYACFPSLTIMPDGRMATTFGTRTVRSHIDKSGGEMTMISADEGKSWQPAKEPIVSRKQLTQDGRIVTANAEGWIYTDAANLDAIKSQHKTVMTASPGVIAYRGGAVARTSSDRGKTWQTISIPVPEECAGLMNFQKIAMEVVTTKGIRLVAVYGQRVANINSNHGKSNEVWLLRSEDDGRNWKCTPMYPDGLPDPETGFDETSLEETVDGKIIAMMRSSRESYLWQATSMDGGLTWSYPRRTNIWGYPAQLLRLKDGRVLCSYGYRREPTGVRACISYDNGNTWDVANEMILRTDGFGNPSDLGYPLVHELSDGSIFMIYYMTTDGVNTHIASTTFTIPKKLPETK